MQPVVMITRPEEDGAPLAREITRLCPGARVILSPLQEIFYAPELPDAGPEMALIFTSRNGVRAWQRVGGPPRRAYCVGDATRALAEAAGHTAVSAGGTVADLREMLLREAPRERMLYLHGKVTKRDLTGPLQAAGLRAVGVEAYQQVARPFSDVAREAMQGAAPVVAPLYSARSARLFAEGWRSAAPLMISAISEAAAEPVRALSPVRIERAAHPDGETMLSLTCGLIAAAHQLEAGGTGH